VAGGITKANPSGYFEIEYTGPWGGIQQDVPTTSVDFGALVSGNCTEIRGRLTAQPAIFPLSPANANYTIVTPTFSAGEVICLMGNVPSNTLPPRFQGAYTFIITTQAVYLDDAGVGSKTFRRIFTFPVSYGAQLVHFGSVVIGKNLYFSSAQQLGLYRLDPLSGTVTEISAQNGSGPFIGADFLGTIAQRLILGNIIGGDGNTTGTITGIDVPGGGGGASYPASGTFTVIGGGGTGAAGTYTTSGGAFSVGSPSTSFTFTSNGTGYIPGAGAQVELVAATGSGAVLNAVVSTAIRPSTSNSYPDYFAWSFPGAFGQLDPNNSLTPGGFNQLTEARGLISGMAIFQSVVFVGHNGGITEVTSNTSSGVAPFSFYPLWSADQGVIVRYASMAQYGDVAAFLSLDNAYILSPAAGLAPIGDRIAATLQDLSGSVASNDQIHIFGVIVQIEGEKHYLVIASQDQQFTVYDYNFKSRSWYEWAYEGTDCTCVIYQAFDVQTVVPPNAIEYDNWLLLASSFPETRITELAPPGPRFFQITGMGVNPLTAQTFSGQFKCEDPSPGRMHSIRRVNIEYANIPDLQGTAPAFGLTLTGQNSPSLTATNNLMVQSSMTATINYPDNSQPVAVGQTLVSQVEPTGPAFTACNTTLSIPSTSSIFFITRIRQICELDKSEVQ
jgi:hypothetical protein